MKRYNSLSEHFQKKYGKKMIKLAIDAGMTCPNRDGTVDSRGCLFCSEDGSGEYAGAVTSEGLKKKATFESQILMQKKLLHEKWGDQVGYIAYLQNFSNTYAPISRLKPLYEELMAYPDIEGLAIATRPDCIDDEVIELLQSVQKQGFIWIELGLQSIHKESEQWMRRHYSLAFFEEKYFKLKQAGIPVVLHLIAGIPSETKEDFLDSVRYVSHLKPFGVKFHMLNVLKETDLEKEYLERPFRLLSQDEYIQWLVEGIGLLNKEIVIHRLTGDGPKEILIAPRWILHKRAVLNGIEKGLKQCGIVQGDNF